MTLMCWNKLTPLMRRGAEEREGGGAQTGSTETREWLGWGGQPGSSSLNLRPRVWQHFVTSRLLTLGLRGSQHTRNTLRKQSYRDRLNRDIDRHWHYFVIFYAIQILKQIPSEVIITEFCDHWMRSWNWKEWPGSAELCPTSQAVERHKGE